MSLLQFLTQPEWSINFAWAIGGIILGYIGGVVVNKANGGSRYRTFAGLLILILVAIGAVLNYENARAQRATTQELIRSVACQKDFNVRYRQALQAQLDAARIVDKASRAFLALYIQDISPAQRTSASNEYYRLADQAEALRNSNPLPVDNPCGGVS